MITCTFEDKGTGSLRHVTANAIVVKEGQILLGRRGTYNGGKLLTEFGKWGLTGGFMGRDETIVQALTREIREETGWEVDNLMLFHIKDNPDRANEDRQNIEFVYVADAVTKVGEGDEEVSELKWFLLDQLPPDADIAFDHAADLALYRDFVDNPFPLPVVGEYKSGRTT